VAGAIPLALTRECGLNNRDVVLRSTNLDFEHHLANAKVTLVALAARAELASNYFVVAARLDLLFMLLKRLTRQ